jgi:SAM-dependent methyltransferase
LSYESPEPLMGRVDPLMSASNFLRVQMNAGVQATLAEGLAYERFMGRWSKLTGQLFVDWLEIPPQQRWLDVGCGTGAFTEVILSRCNPKSVVAFDPSERQLAYAFSRAHDNRVTFRRGDAMEIEAEDDQFDVAASALVLNFLPDQGKAVREMSRVVRAGGTVAVYVWDFAGRRNITQHLTEAIASIAPDAERAARGAQQAGTTTPAALMSLFPSAGLEAVEAKSLDITAEFEDFDDYWESNATLISPISVIGTAGASLSGDQILLLKQILKDRLPKASSGKISFGAGAWAVRAVKRSPTRNAR